MVLPEISVPVDGEERTFVTEGDVLGIVRAGHHVDVIVYADGAVIGTIPDTNYVSAGYTSTGDIVRQRNGR